MNHGLEHPWQAGMIPCDHCSETTLRIDLGIRPDTYLAEVMVLILVSITFHLHSSASSLAVCSVHTRQNLGESHSFKQYTEEGQ